MRDESSDRVCAPAQMAVEGVSGPFEAAVAIGSDRRTSGSRRVNKFHHVRWVPRRRFGDTVITYRFIAGEAPLPDRFADSPAYPLAYRTRRPSDEGPQQHRLHYQVGDQRAEDDAI